MITIHYNIVYFLDFAIKFMFVAGLRFMENGINYNLT